MWTRLSWPICCCVALATLLPGAAGCGKRLRGVKMAEQTVLRSGKSVYQQADGIEAVVTPVRVPWGSKDSPVGFAVEVTNRTDSDIHLFVSRMELHDPAGRILNPASPERLLRSFGTGTPSQPTVRTAAHSHRHRRHVYRRHHGYYYPRYYSRYGYPYDYWIIGGYGGGFGVGGDPDPYYEQRRTARFLSELLTDQTIEPRHVAFGHVVFPYELEDDDQLTLVVPLVRDPANPTTQPTETAGQNGADWLPVIRLTFHFEVD